MKIAVASGKGGTGKTTLSVALALAAPGTAQLLDCDVEEPNCHLFLNLNDKTESVVEVLKPIVDENICDNNGLCSQICQFNAIISINSTPLIFHDLCHSCGGCTMICPAQAISEKAFRIGILEKSSHRDLKLVTGRLDVGQAIAIPLIKAVKKQISDAELVIMDAPPGTSCPFVEVVSDADFVILITEPTPFGRHDLSLAVETVRSMKIPFAVIVNRINARDNIITQFCEKNDIPVLLQIPEEREIAQSCSNGNNLLQAKPELIPVLRNILSGIRENIENKKPLGSAI
jgi:MinD superfamily P-loop ATPase